jgi:hypothetical protein
MNVNSQVPNVVIPTMNNTDEEDNAPLNHIYITAMQERMPSISTTVIGLGRPLHGTSRRLSKHRGSTMERAISRISMNRNTNVGPAHKSGNFAIR